MQRRTALPLSRGPETEGGGDEKRTRQVPKRNATPAGMSQVSHPSSPSPQAAQPSGGRAQGQGTGCCSSSSRRSPDTASPLIWASVSPICKHTSNTGMFLPGLGEGVMGRGATVRSPRRAHHPRRWMFAVWPRGVVSGARWEKLALLRAEGMLCPALGPLWGCNNLLSAVDLPDLEEAPPETQVHFPLPWAPGQSQVSDPLTQQRAEPG